MDEQRATPTLTDDDIKTEWRRSGATSSPTALADPDTKDADAEDADSTDTTGSDSDSSDSDSTDSDSDSTDS